MISIVVPVFNEARRLPASLDRIFAFMDARHPGYEVVLVDDGSTDDTVEVARRHVGPRVELRIESYGGNRGKGYAVRCGIARSRGELVLFTDADLSTPIEELDRLLVAVEAGADIAIGTRAHPQSDVRVRQPFYRDRAGKLFNSLVRVILLPDLHDTQCGFKLCRRAPLVPVLERMTVDRFAFDVELLYLARLTGLRIVEVPVIWVNSPDSRVRLAHAAAAFVDVLRIRWRHRKR
jgi:dolichyl-phosphate beta-glucosyltransferase